ncbi:MAG TPA: VCBS repeat-containing protein, partial [Chitinophagaceae bacterium]|nr:VCBS repeat-containing protein [Chitinophagaceae bacterium]
MYSVTRPPFSFTYCPVFSTWLIGSCMKQFAFAFLTALLFAFTACRHAPGSLFEQVSASHSGITFKNTIVETDSINPMDVVNIYNGGGVGIGDFNNDGLQDIYLTGNMVASKLYLNKGNFTFEDV